MKYIINLYLISIVLSVLGGWLTIKYAHRLGFVDNPCERSSHYMPTPRGGGIGILAAFIFVSIFLNINFSFWFSGTVLSIVSFWGDRHDLSTLFRICVQLVASIIMLIGLLSHKALPSFSYLLIIPYTIYIVGTANYYNFMDGINGIAGITGAIAFGFLSCYAIIFGHPTAYMVLSICLSLACLGFLPYNIPDAKVFMGDVGSIFLGFVFASFVALYTAGLADFICLISFLFPFYADELTTLAVRIRDGDKLTRPHRKHVYQLLANELNIAHWKVSAGYGGLQIIVSLAALFLRPHGVIPMILLLSTFFLLFLFFSFAVRRKIAASFQAETTGAMKVKENNGNKERVEHAG